MPRGDGTGPMGMGPMTGEQLDIVLVMMYQDT